MNKEYLKYATDMSIVGDRILRISNNRFKKNILEATTKEELKSIYSEFGVEAKQYGDCLNDLCHIDVPSRVKDEHMRIIDGVERLVKGTEIFSKAIDIDKGSVNIEEIKIGFRLHEEAEKIVKKEVENICNIFGI